MDIDEDRMRADGTVDSFSEASFTFLDELAENNDTEWFDEHRAVFKEKLQHPFADCLLRVSERLEDAEVPLSGSKDTMFRIVRDVRFTEDKRPYNESVSGLLTASGEKSEAGPLVYLVVDAKGGMTAAGFYKLDTKRLNRIRKRILERDEEFARIVSDIRDAGHDLEDENSLTSMPRGFEDHKDHELAPILKRKSLVVMNDLPKTAWLDGSVVDRVADHARLCMPLLAFGHRALEG